MYCSITLACFFVRTFDSYVGTPISYFLGDTRLLFCYSCHFSRRNHSTTRARTNGVNVITFSAETAAAATALAHMREFTYLHDIVPFVKILTHSTLLDAVNHSLDSPAAKCVAAGTLVPVFHLKCGGTCTIARPVYTGRFA